VIGKREFGYHLAELINPPLIGNESADPPRSAVVQTMNVVLSGVTILFIARSKSEVPVTITI
jgi:hypothetical protein